MSHFFNPPFCIGSRIRAMKTLTILLLFCLSLTTRVTAQEIVPMDAEHWDVRAESHVFEKHLGKDAIYLQGGSIFAKNLEFLDGTIEFDIFLKEEQMFPGVCFRGDAQFMNGEQFFLRPHLSGKPDANQGAPAVNGITPWQLYFGPSYSFAYDYKFDDWTHVKVVVNGRQAQAYLDYATEAQLSWNLFHDPQAGSLFIRGGSTAMYIADVRIDPTKPELVDFNPIPRDPIEGVITEWEISDMFEEELLNDPANLGPVIEARSWQGTITVEEGVAANISRIQVLRNGEPGSTVFARIVVTSDRDQLKLFEFGYSDAVIAILNGTAIYKGNNKWRSRDYRYLGTVGLFDAIYLDLKRGKNTLLLAVSESFGGWLVTGRFEDTDGLRIEP